MIKTNQPRKIVIIGITSDIATGLTRLFVEDRWDVIGTSRLKLTLQDISQAAYLNITNDRSFEENLDNLQNQIKEWDAIVFAVGSMLPIGKFFDLDFKDVENSMFLNLIGPMKILHRLWGKRNSSSRCNVFFFAGGGTNGTFDNYLAYALSKISCIKLVELLSSEYQDVGFFSIGTGYVKTKIHQETTEAGLQAGSNLLKTLELLKTNGTSIKQIYDVIRWCIHNSALASGRNFSVRDDFKFLSKDSNTLLDIITTRPDSFKLRRDSNNWRNEND